MKQSPELARIQELMEPGVLSGHGFLGDDKRNLLDILLADDSVIKAKGLTHGKIAQRMLYFTEAGSRGLGEEVVVNGSYIVRTDEHRGLIHCPFGDDYSTGKTNTIFTNKKLNKTIVWSRLNIHMIEAHGFYEGKGAAFRVESEEIGEILGLL